MDVRGKLNEAYQCLQRLSIQSTRDNVKCLFMAQSLIKEAFDALGGEKNDVESGTEGRDKV